MNKIEELIQQLCPDGVEFNELGNVIQLEKGKQLNKELLTETGKYPAYNGGMAYSGFTDNYNYNENTIIISQGGASAGFVNFINTKFYANAHCYVVLPKKEIVENRYVYHFLKLNQEKLTEKQHGAGIPALRTNEISKIQIPIPPLAIQKEIAVILDKFTTLEAELEAELEARRTQYNYYRDQLLKFEGTEVEWKTLGEVCEKIISGKNKFKSNEGEYPVFGSTGIIGYTNKYIYENDCLLIARVGANAGFVYKSKGKFDVSDNTLIIRPNNGYTLTFAYFQLLNLGINKFAVGGGQPLITARLLSNLKIPIPPIEEQKRIVGILNKFDALVNDISVGLPAEIEARRKQYEFYRGKLLTFTEVSNG